MKIKPLCNELDELIKKPQPWGPMVISRAKKAMEQAAEMLVILNDKVNDLQEALSLHETYKTAAILKRNIEILNRYKRGVSMIKMAKEYGLSRQRVHMIIVTTQKQLESQNESSRIKGISGESNKISSGAIGSGKEKDRPSNTNRRW